MQVRRLIKKSGPSVVPNDLAAALAAAIVSQVRLDSAGLQATRFGCH